MQNLMWVGLIGAVVALLFALIQRNKVMSFSEGTDRMKKIAGSIREGANAYLKHQYATVGKVFAVVFHAFLSRFFQIVNLRTVRMIIAKRRRPPRSETAAPFHKSSKNAKIYVRHNFVAENILKIYRGMAQW